MIIGISFLVVGALMLINVMFPEFSINWQLIWPAVLIFISIYQMFKNRIFNFSMIILFYVGSFFLIKNLNLTTMNIDKLFLPILIILIGTMIVIDRIFNENNQMIKMNSKGIPTYYGIFGGVDEKVTSVDFLSTSIYSVFGGVDLDFRGAKFKHKEMNMKIISIFGGSNLVFDEDVKVVINSMAILGGNENKHINIDKHMTTVYVTCYSILGGTEIK